ncbi:trans-sialidase [Trypanosoma cruzi]|uniref:Trans-sialidase n=1 Tax=Trypanosoma cruzi TaxID=5693 RepID=A0A7J6Y0F7_TRYCR|nr:trans-sialidase [Trypanosoma cruzi]
MGEDPLPRVALWVIARSVCVVCRQRAVAVSRCPWDGAWRRWRCVASCCCPLVDDCWRCVRLLCGGPNPLTRGLTALRWCVCVCEGWCGVAGQGEGRGGAFPACNLFLPCALCCFLLFSPVILSSCVPAWSGRMLTGHVDCECLLTASISLSLSPPVCLSFPVGCGVLHRVRAGPHTPTARRDLPCCCSFLWAMVLRAVPSGLSRAPLSAWVLCSAPH